MKSTLRHVLAYAKIPLSSFDNFTAYLKIAKRLTVSFPYDPTADYLEGARYLETDTHNFARLDLGPGTLRITQMIYEISLKGKPRSYMFHDIRCWDQSPLRKFCSSLLESPRPEVLDWFLTLPFEEKEKVHILRKASEVSEDTYILRLIKRFKNEGLLLNEEDVYDIASGLFLRGYSSSLSVLAEHYPQEYVDSYDFRLWLDAVQDSESCLALARLYQISPEELGEILSYNTSRDSKISYYTSARLETYLQVLKVRADVLLERTRYSEIEVEHFEILINQTLRDPPGEYDRIKYTLGRFLVKCLKDPRESPPLLKVLLKAYPNLKEDYEVIYLDGYIRKFKITNEEKARIVLEIFPFEKLRDLILQGSFPHLTTLAFKKYPQIFPNLTLEQPEILKILIR